MPRYIALLRGINLGGNKMIRMEELRQRFEALGLDRVASYINSGNIAFDHPSAAADVMAEKLERCIENDFGMTVPVVIRAQAEIDSIIRNNPFDGQYESHKQMHVLFLNCEVPAEKVEFLRDNAPETERYAIIGHEIYALLLDGVAGSLLTKGFFERKPKLMYTGRNWRTVEKLLEL